ncbi:AAA family ATPase [Paraburkholderia sp.]|uniref:AAA family ATPase n=1 Tax=Paraburkholderia sp. TaxID=1926495 RepID=UPI002D4023D0|nr:AAA family ATPase [Paraburkholderia sp.]HZZ05640.1 AAA family ATPase [Paraburkholderia sp.]
MSVLTIRKAEREGARLVICLAGISGSGKTFTALQLAYGLANFNALKVGLLDTENRRGSLYADIIKNEAGETQSFLIGDLDAPYSPKRYTEALHEFQAAGVEVLVIDSGSHEWEGTGGCEEIAENAGRNGNKDWAPAKGAHKKFMNVLLASDMHIIVCIRAREKIDMKGKDAAGKTVVKSLGIQPICEKNFMFEMTASMLMWDEGQKQDVMKCPEALKPMLGRGNGYITPADGKALRDWVDGAKALDPQVETARNMLRSISEQGMEAYRAAWPKLSKKVQKALADDGSHDRLKLAAEAFDKAREAAKPGGEALAGFNAELAGDDGAGNFV